MSASLGLLCDLFGELGIARGDGDYSNLARALDVVQAEADRVIARIEEAANDPVSTSQPVGHGAQQLRVVIR